MKETDTMEKVLILFWVGLLVYVLWHQHQYFAQRSRRFDPRNRGRMEGNAPIVFPGGWGHWNGGGGHGGGWSGGGGSFSGGGATGSW